MHVLNLHIQTPAETFVHSSLKEAHLPGADGIVGILPNHASMIIGLRAGIIHLSKKNKPTSHYFIHSGVAYIQQNSCLILTENSQPLSALDPSLLKETLEKYYDDLAGVDVTYEQRFIESQIAITRAMLKAVGRHAAS